MWERVIYRIIKAELDGLQSSPRRLRQFFRFQRGLDATEAEALETKFLAQPPRLLHSFSQREGTLPCIVISLESEEPVQAYLGDNGSILKDEEAVEDAGGIRSEVPARKYSVIMQSRYNITVLVEAHPDIGIFLYELMKFIIARNKLAFLSAGAHDLTWKGTGLSYSRTYDPAYAFERTVEVTLTGAFEAPLPALDEVFRTIEGLHVNLTPEGETPEDSDALITPQT